MQTDYYKRYLGLNMLAELHNPIEFEACLACTIHLIWSIRPLAKAVNLISSNNLCLHKHSMQVTLHHISQGTQGQSDIRNRSG